MSDDDKNGHAVAGFTVFDSENIMETMYAHYNNGFMMLPRINVDTKVVLPGGITDTTRTVTQLDRVIGDYSFSMFSNTSPYGTYYSDLATDFGGVGVYLGSLQVQDLQLPPATKVTLSLGACGNVSHQKPNEDKGNTAVFYAGLCLDTTTPGNDKFNGASYAGGDTTDPCYKCSDTLLPNDNGVKPVCPSPLQLTAPPSNSVTIDVTTQVVTALNKVEGVDVGKDAVYIGVAHGDDEEGCGTCSFPYGGGNVSNVGNIGIVTGAKVESNLPDDVNSMNDYLLKYSCLKSVQEDRIKFIFKEGTIDEETRYLTNYQPGMPRCDELVNVYCNNPQNIDKDECICYKELDEIVDRFGVSEVPYPVQCLGGCADNPKAYKRGSWADQKCNIEVCTKFAELTGSQLVSQGVTDLICDGKSLVVGNNQPVVNYVQLSPINGITTTTEWVLISIGILYFVLFVTWVGLYLYKKFGPKT